MDGEFNPADLHRLSKLVGKFRSKQYRDAYVAAQAREVLAKQMRNFRGDLSQAEYAAKIDKQKTVVGRLENPAYGGWSLRTMLEVARKEDVAVIVRFIDFPTFTDFTDDMSDKALCPASYNEATLDDYVRDTSHKAAVVGTGYGAPPPAVLRAYERLIEQATREETTATPMTRSIETEWIKITLGGGSVNTEKIAANDSVEIIPVEPERKHG